MLKFTFVCASITLRKIGSLIEHKETCRKVMSPCKYTTQSVSTPQLYWGLVWRPDLPTAGTTRLPTELSVVSVSTDPATSMYPLSPFIACEGTGQKCHRKVILATRLWANTADTGARAICKKDRLKPGVTTLIWKLVSMFGINVREQGLQFPMYMLHRLGPHIYVHLPSIQTCLRFQIGGCSWGVSSGKLN